MNLLHLLTSGPLAQQVAPSEATSLYVVVLLILLAVLLSRMLTRMSRMEGVGRFRRWLPSLFVLVWGGLLAAIGWTMTAEGLHARLVLLLFFLAVIALANLGWLRSVMAGIVLHWERRVRPGDSIRVGDVHGEVVAMGLRAVRVRAPDGVIHEVPHELVISSPLATYSRSGEVLCDIDLEVPAHLQPEPLIAMAREAALLTPLASPRHRPEVFIAEDHGNRTTLRLTIRGYAFSPLYRDRYRSDVLARLHHQLRRDPIDVTLET